MNATDLNPYLGRYRIKREIGRGFSSLVYEALDTVRDRSVALKVLTLGQSLSDDRRRDMAERFVREARAISALSHPGIVSIYEVGQAGDGRQFIAMELLEGESLRARLDREESLAPEDAVPIALQVADALQYAHERGIIHRDIKPDNIFVMPDGRTKLMDFGVAHILSEGALTQTGTVVGSPAYMSPEQIGGQMLDGGSDVFSLGVTLAEMLTGHKPFDAPTIPAVMNRILHNAPRMDGVKLRPLRRTLERALAKNPVTRYVSAGGFRRCAASPGDTEAAGCDVIELGYIADVDPADSSAWQYRQPPRLVDFESGQAISGANGTVGRSSSRCRRAARPVSAYGAQACPVNCGYGSRAN